MNMELKRGTDTSAPSAASPAATARNLAPGKSDKAHCHDIVSYSVTLPFPGMLWDIDH